MANNNPIDLESAAGGTPAVTAREIDNPDNNTNNTVVPLQSTPPVKTDPSKFSAELQAKMKYIPEQFHDRVAKLTREELVGSGIPLDREAYSAYLYAEKMMRDERRNKEKAALRESGAPGGFDA